MNILQNKSIKNLHSLYNTLSSLEGVNLVKNGSVSSIVTVDSSAWPNLTFSDRVDYLNDIFVLNDLVKNIDNKKIPPLLLDYNSNCNLMELKKNKVFLIDNWYLMDLKIQFEIKNLNKYQYSKISDNDIEDWCEVVSHSLFKKKNLNSDLFLQLTKNRADILSLKIDGKIVATSLVYYDEDNIAGIYMVSVLEDYRGKGFGKLIMNYTFKTILDKGLNEVTLQSTKLGLPMYNNLNFELTGKINLLYKI